MNVLEAWHFVRYMVVGCTVLWYMLSSFIYVIALQWPQSLSLVACMLEIGFLLHMNQKSTLERSDLWEEMMWRLQ